MKSKVIGEDIHRIDGPIKVTGQAKYTADHNLKDMVYGSLLGSTISNGTIASMDVSAAEKMPGVLKIYHHATVTGLYNHGGGENTEQRIPLSDHKIDYFGQYIALVVAKTWEQSQAAVRAIKVAYDAQEPVLEASLEGQSLNSGYERGNAEQDFAGAQVKVDHTYTTATYVHNPMELHGTVAVYGDDGYTIYESTQSVMGVQRSLSNALGETKERVRVFSKYIGSGFGGKLATWPHATLAAVAARDLGKPVKVITTRKMGAETVGHRPKTHQRVRIGASKDGQISSFIHEYISETSINSGYRENCGEATPSLYGAPNLKVASSVVHLNVGSPTSMRGPGAVPGTFATETAMDELAVELGMDPIELRIKNEPTSDLAEGVPFSSRHYIECLQEGAKRFGWSQAATDHVPNPGNAVRHGFGVAGCSWFAGKGYGQARVDLMDDGTASVSCGTQDIGTGTYTVMAQLASQRLGIDPHRIAVNIGDSRLPAGPTSGGSTVTATVVSAVHASCEDAIKQLISAATGGTGNPFAGANPSDLAFTDGWVHQSGKAPESGQHFADILKALQRKSISGQGDSRGGGTGGNVSMHSYGAHFVEVVWDPSLARIKVERVLTMIDAGQIINTMTGRNQIQGAVMMGVGMAMMEQSIYDRKSGAPINSNYAEYLVPTHLDAPKVEVVFLDYPDYHLNELGARGIGEIGLAGISAAIVNAVYHATGKRVRDIPITIEKLLA